MCLHGRSPPLVLLVWALAACGPDEVPLRERLDAASATPDDAADAASADASAPPADADAPAPVTLDTRTRCTADPADNPPGSGRFGCWFEDRHGLPAYEYTRGLVTDLGLNYTRRDGDAGADDHWHQVGNTRITAMAHADGRVRLFDGTRGPKWVSEFSAGRVTVDGAPLAEGVQPRLTFGVGYVEWAVQDADTGVAARRTVYAPYGDTPMLVVEHEIANDGAAVRALAVRELWDARLHFLTAALVYGSAPDGSDLEREQRLTRYAQTAQLQRATGAVMVDTDRRPDVEAPPPTQESDEDYYPGTLGLVLLDGLPDAWGARLATACAAGRDDCEPAALTTRGRSTTRIGPPPFGVDAEPLEDASLGPAPLSDRPFAPWLERALTVDPGQRATVRFVVLYDEDVAAQARVERLLTEPPISLDESAAAWDAVLPRADLPAPDPAEAAMARELRWHGYYLLSAANEEAFYGVHDIDQGSAYGYLQGLRGAARDNLINSVAVLWTRPDLAQEQIRYILQTTTPGDAKISYGTAGFGQLEDATIHGKPSDLDLWLLWAIVEYVQATRDFEFLELEVPYWPPYAGRTDTVRTRIARSLEWLTESIGVGEHGMLKVGSGDWSDGITWLAERRGVFLEDGESSFNTAFAAYVFPRVADLLAGRDDALAGEYRAWGQRLADAMAAQYNGDWFYRAWDGLGVPIGDNRLFLEHHVWILVGDVPTPAQRASVIANIDRVLADPSPIGAWLLYPPIEGTVLIPGWDVNGGVWSAMNGILTWGLSRSSPERAWAELVANSMIRHTAEYPHTWYGIWSGPDAYNATYADRPGETFYHLATPMTDFPVTNSNRHALPQIAAIKLAGVESDPDGLVIDPRLPFPRFEYETPTAAVRFAPEGVSGHTRFAAAGRVQLRLPEGLDPETARVTVGDAPVAHRRTELGIAFDVPAGLARWTVSPP
jgi:hypothetical protein